MEMNVDSGYSDFDINSYFNEDYFKTVQLTMIDQTQKQYNYTTSEEEKKIVEKLNELDQEKKKQDDIIENPLQNAVEIITDSVNVVFTKKKIDSFISKTTQDVKKTITKKNKSVPLIISDNALHAVIIRVITNQKNLQIYTGFKLV